MSSKRFFKRAKKNKKGNERRSQSPSNSRSIPEKPSFYFPKFNSLQLLKLYGGSLRIFVVSVFIIAVVIVSVDMRGNFIARQKIDLQRAKLIRELKFWEDFLVKSQNYSAAYFQASILEYRLGNTSKAKIYVEKGLSLDPNSADGQKLEKFLVGK